jgi:polyhydroxyalkanoate synthesis repressor PhaR
LYDTQAKEYITLEGIAALIHEGDEVQVVDHASGDDLTALTLTQIILEREKRQGGYLPKSVLTGLIRAGGDTLSNLRRTFVSPVDFLRQIDEEIEGRLHGLQRRGELAEEEVRRLRSKLLNWDSPLSRRSEPSDEELVEALSRRGVPTRDEYEKLLAQIEDLSEKLDSLDKDTDQGKEHENQKGIP